jgi:hypothetical protein
MEIGEDRTVLQKAKAAYLLSGGPHLSTCHQVTWNSQVAGWRCVPNVDLLPFLCDCNRAIFLLIHLKPKDLLSCPPDTEYTYECRCTLVSTKLAHPRFQQCVYISWLVYLYTWVKGPNQACIQWFWYDHVNQLFNVVFTLNATLNTRW